MVDRVITHAIRSQRRIANTSWQTEGNVGFPIGLLARVDSYPKVPNQSRFTYSIRASC